MLGYHPTSFIGRAEEVAVVSRLLTGNRHLTLTGPGGVGKTRLALAVTDVVTSHFPNGIHIVPLSAVTDTALVVPSIEAALQLQSAANDGSLAGIIAFVQERRVLLVFDNFEQIADAAPVVTNLLERCPALSILITSRIPLHLAGEQEYVVPPLALPDPGAEIDLDVLRQSDAIALFTRRTQQSKPDFTLTADNAATIANICMRLDGLPLALELAAARMKLMTPQALLARLDRRLELLTGGPRDAPSRQRTMRATITWSHDLLTSDEQRLFRQLAAFSGGWTIDAAATVCTVDGEPLDRIAALVEHNLIYPMERPGDAARFGMLETIREYGLEQLEASGEADAVQSRHVDVFLQLAEQAAPQLDGRDQSMWMNRLDPEHDNFRTAISWLLEQRDVERGLRMIAALSWFWNIRGFYAEAWTHARSFIDLPEASGRTVGRARALGASAYALHFLGDHEQARANAEEALAINEETGDHAGRARILIPLLVIASATGEDERHLQLASDLLATARRLDDRQNVARALAQLGSDALRRGDIRQALVLAQESLELAERLENRATVALAHALLGDVYLHGHDLIRAGAAYRKSLAIYFDIDYRHPVARGLAQLASLACACSQLQRSATLYAAAAARRAAIDIIVSPSERAIQDDDLAVIRARLTDEQFQSAWDSGQSMSVAAAIAYALETHPAPSATQPAAVAGLTPRELEVLRLIAAGGSNKQIAAELHLSIRTVERHITNLYTKIGARGKADATAWALRHQLA
jgi:non-specific serine/threonine protein kinase